MAKLSMLQLPKVKGFMECFEPFPGCTLVYTDFSALEMKVAAHLTQDASLMKLYGPNAKPHDAHCFNACGIEIFRERMSQYYDVENPTPEGIALAKKHCGDIRDITKMAGYAMAYGAQAQKLYDEINQAGFKITMEDAHGIFNGYWELYAGMKRFEQHLRRLWQQNNGWVPNGRGRPLTIPKPFRSVTTGKMVDYKKDLLNRVVQSTGHDILMGYLKHLYRLRDEWNVPMTPWLLDKHDASTWQVNSTYVDLAVKAFEEAYRRLNDELQWSVQITGQVKTGQNMAEVEL